MNGALRFDPVSHAGTKSEEDRGFEFSLCLWWFLWLSGLLNAGLASIFLYTHTSYGLARFKLAEDFNQRVGANDALAGLTRCFHDNLLERNASIADFTICLKQLGIPETPDGFKFPGMNPDF